MAARKKKSGSRKSAAKKKAAKTPRVAAKKKAAKAPKRRVAAKKKVVRVAGNRVAAKKPAIAPRPAMAARAPTPSPAPAADPALVTELDNRIAIVRANLRELVDQAASSAGAANEELLSQRIAEQEAKLASLRKQREELAPDDS